MCHTITKEKRSPFTSITPSFPMEVITNSVNFTKTSKQELQKDREELQASSLKSLIHTWLSNKLIPTINHYSSLLKYEATEKEENEDTLDNSGLPPTTVNVLKQNIKESTLKIAVYQKFLSELTLLEEGLTSAPHIPLPPGLIEQRDTLKGAYELYDKLSISATFEYIFNAYKNSDDTISNMHSLPLENATHIPIQSDLSSLTSNFHQIKEDWIRDSSATMGTPKAEDYIIKAGALILNQLISDRSHKKEALAQAISEYSSIKQLIDDAQIQKQTMLTLQKENPSEDSRIKTIEARTNFWNIYLSEAAVTGRDKIRKAKREYEGTWKENADELHKLLHFIRPDNPPEKKDRFVPLPGDSWNNEIDSLTTAIKYFPADWVTSSDHHKEHHGVISVTGNLDRGFYASDECTIAISGKDNELDRITCSFHELGHRFEYTVPGLYEASECFFKRRVSEHGDPDTHSPIEIDITPRTATEKETALKAGFFDHYVGKVYPDEWKAHEIISMGCEYLFTNPTVVWEKDPEYAAFIYGLLALYGEVDLRKIPSSN